MYQIKIIYKNNEKKYENFKKMKNNEIFMKK